MKYKDKKTIKNFIELKYKVFNFEYIDLELGIK